MVGNVRFSVRRNADGTATFRCGRYVEHIHTDGYGLAEVYERLKMAALGAGLSLSAETLEALMREAVGLDEPTPSRPGPTVATGRKPYTRGVSDDEVHRLLVARRSWVDLAEVARRFNVSESTARRRLDSLAASGRAERKGRVWRGRQ